MNAPYKLLSVMWNELNARAHPDMYIVSNASRFRSRYTEINSALLFAFFFFFYISFFFHPEGNN